MTHITTNLQERLARELDELVAVGEKLSRDAARSSSGLGPDRVEELSSIASRGAQLIRRLYGHDSPYELSLRKVMSEKHFTSMHNEHYEHVSELTGILKGIRHEVKSGLLSDFRQMLRAEIFSDFMEMAEHLLEQGYKDAAAVLLGAVLEDSLRKIADSHGVSTTAPNGKPLTIDPLNIALAKAGVYNALVQKQVTTWANLRNDAAHGRPTGYDIEQVRQMLLFLQKFCADFVK